MLLSLASVPFMTRHLGEVDYGYYVTVTSVLFILGGITEAGLTNLGTREYAVRHGEDRATFLRDLVGLRLTLTITGITFAVALTAVTGANSSVVAGVGIMGVGMLLTLTQQTYGVSLSAQLRLGWVSVLELIRQATLSLSTIGLVIARREPDAVLLRQRHERLRDARGHAARAAQRGRPAARVRPGALEGDPPRGPALRAGRGRRAHLLPPRDHPAELRRQRRGDRHLLGGVPGRRDRRRRSRGSLVSSAFPILARAAGQDDTARLRYGLGKLFDVAIVFGVLISLSIIIGAQFAIDVIAGEDFQESVGVLELQALCLITTFVVAVWSFALLSLKRYRELLVVNAMATATSAGLTLFFVRGLDLGAEGAALATFGAELVLAGGYLVRSRAPIGRLAPSFSGIARILPGAAAMIAIWLALDLHPVIEVALATIAYVGLAFAMRAVPEELVNAVRDRRTAS